MTITTIHTCSAWFRREKTCFKSDEQNAGLKIKRVILCEVQTYFEELDWNAPQLIGKASGVVCIVHTGFYYGPTHLRFVARAKYEATI